MERPKETRRRGTLHESYSCAAAAAAAKHAAIPDDSEDEGLTVEYGPLTPIELDSYGSIRSGNGLPVFEEEGGVRATVASHFVSTLRSIPSIILLAILNLMMSVPFGSAYFSPLVPLGGIERQALGMRLCLLSGAIAQGVFGCTGLSTLDPVAVIQLAALTPFYHHFSLLAKTAASNAGVEDVDSCILPTTLFLMSLSTITAGLLYFVVGRLGFAKAAAFFPRYVMLGLVGGCGIFFILLSISVSVGPRVAPDADLAAAPHAWSLHFLVTAAFVAGIRVLRVFIPKEKFMLLDPVYFLTVPVVFYAGMAALGVSVDRAVDLGYFFKDPQASDSADLELPSVSGGWGAIDFGKVRWETVGWAMPSLMSLSLLSIMLVVPFPPLIAVYLESESTFDINKEFVAHGYANILIGFLFPGGLFTCESYANTVLLKNAGSSGGKICNALLSLATFILCIYGPELVDGIPRCMAGTLMLDMGLALFLDAVKAHNYTPFEYASIWIILCVMTAFSMTAGLVAGLILALFNFTQQSFVEEDPIRRMKDMAEVPSTCLRSIEALQVLDGLRKTIVLFQLQGHLFFGNFPRLQEEILDFLNKKKAKGDAVSMAIIDLDFVVGIDSSAASLVEKMIGQLKKTGIITVLVSSSHFSDATRNLFPPTKQIPSSRTNDSLRSSTILDETSEIHGEYYNTLNAALMACEDTLLRRRRVGLEKKYTDNIPPLDAAKPDKKLERDTVLHLLSGYNAGHAPPAPHRFAGENDAVLADMFSVLKRETFSKGETLWESGDNPVSAKILLKGSFSATGKGESDYTGPVNIGNIVGLRALLLSEKHRRSLRCEEDGSIAYSLDYEAYESLCQKNPKAGRVMGMVLARNLSLRLRAVTNQSGVALMSA